MKNWRKDKSHLLYHRSKGMWWQSCRPFNNIAALPPPLCPCFSKWGVQTSSLERLWEQRNVTTHQTRNLHINKIPQETRLHINVWEATGQHRGSSHALDRPSRPCGSMIGDQVFFRVHLISSISPHPSWNVLLFPRSEEPQIILQACPPM